ncbi:MAG: tyrosine-type recombinase/integrase [Solirubrobacterales bacterium]
MANVLADVRRDLWIEPGRGSRRRKQRVSDPFFGPFASRLLNDRKRELSEGTLRYLTWALSHLSPCFSDWRLHEIDSEAVDGYRAVKVHQAEVRRRAIEVGRPERDADGRIMRPLSAASINKTIDVLQWVLAIAEERGLIERNPARGRRRRIPTRGPAPVFLDSAIQIEALLAAAAELDRRSESRIPDRLPLIGALVFAGLRSGELAGLRRRDIDLVAGRILVRQSKSAAGQREVAVLPILRSLLAQKPGLSPCRHPQELVFSTRTGRARNKDNIRACILLPVRARADELLEQEGRPPLPLGLSPHKLRHTFASILIACGEDPASAMYQLGHTSAEFTLRTYTHMMRRGAAERERLQSLVDSGWSSGASP